MPQDACPEPDSGRHPLVSELMQQLDQTRDQLRQLQAHMEELVAHRTASLAGERERDRLLLDNLRQVVFVLDEHDRIELLVGNVIGITGYTTDEMLSRSTSGQHLMLTDATSWAAFGQECQRVRAGLSPRSVVLSLIDRAGEQRWVQIYLMPLPGSPGDPLRIQGVVDDVSEQHRVELAIESLSEASSVVQQASLSNAQVLEALTSALSELGFASAVFQLEQDQIVRVTAHRFDESSLQAIEASIGKPLTGAYMDLDAVPIFARIADTHEPQRFATVGRYWSEILPKTSPALGRVLGRVAPALQGIALPLLADGELQGILMVLAETIPSPLRPALTTFANQAAIAMRNAQLVDQLAEREQQYRSIFESSQSGLVVVDRQGRIVQANPTLCRLYNARHAAMIGEQLADLLIPGDAEQIKAMLAGLQNDQPWQGEATALRKDGLTFSVELHSGSLWYQGQHHALVMLDDTTERVQARAALLRAEKLRALGQMAGGIAHDFNNILVGIRGFADLALLDIDEDTTMLRQDLDHILRGANDAAEAVRRLQSLYRESDDTSDFSVQDLDTLVEETLALTQPRWKDQPQSLGLTIKVQRKLTSPPAILGNGSELRRVLTNLIVNAIEAMPQGGVLRIETDQVVGFSVLRVQDSGAGIPEDKLQTIFEPFYSTKKSSGLGLAIAHTITERHGGAIEAKSSSGQGACFEIRLPWHEPAQAQPVVTTPDTRIESAQLSVLLVDDESAVRGLLCRFLSRSGHKVSAVGSGEQALAQLHEQPFDLLITDLGMPDVSGYEVVEVAHRLHPQMPIILSTGWGESITPDKLQELHAAALLGKPFTYRDVLAALNLALSR